MSSPGPAPGGIAARVSRSRSAARRFLARGRRDLAGIDERTLMALRLGLALLVLLDLAFRLPDLTAHYSDFGVLPRHLAAEWDPAMTRLFPLYFASGSALWPLALMALTALAAALLLIGWRTPWAAAACWYLVSCLHARAAPMTHSGDELLRLLLVWAILLPLGRAGSLDDRRRPSRGSRQVVTLATFGIQAHITLLFWSQAAASIDPAAALATLHLDHLATPWGLRLRELEVAMRYAGLTIGGLGLLGPILLWLPVWSGPIRFFVVVTFWQLHLLVIAPALTLGIQPWAAALAWLVFLPGWFWTFVSEGRLAPQPAGRERDRGLGRRLAVLPAAAFLALALCGLAPSGLGRLLAPESALRSSARILGLAPPDHLVLPDADEIDGWYVLRGHLASGLEWDVWNDGPPEIAKPPVPARTFRNPRWAAYLKRLVAVDAAPYRRRLLGYLCARWNSGRGPSEQALELELVFMLERFEVARGESRHLPVLLESARCAAPTA